MFLYMVFNNYKLITCSVIGTTTVGVPLQPPMMMGLGLYDDGDVYELV